MIYLDYSKTTGIEKCSKTQQNSNFVPSDGGQKEKEDPVKVLVDITKLFMFQNLTELSKLAAVLGGFTKVKMTCMRMLQHTDIIFW